MKKKIITPIGVALVLCALHYQSFGQASNDLSNLDSTSINQKLLPQTDNSLSLGSSDLNWKDLYLKGGIYVNGTDILAIPHANTDLSNLDNTSINQSLLPQVKPEEIGLDPKRLQVAYDLLEKWTTGSDAPVYT